MNKVLTAIDKSGSFRVYVTISTELVQEAVSIHQTTPVASAALGRTLTGAGLMSLMLKNPLDKLTVIFKGDGPAKQILATADGSGNVKGYIANPDVELPLKENGKLNVGGAVGKGELTVIKDLGLKEPYVGTVSLVSGEIAEDLTAYYYISEQQNTAISLGVKIETDWSVGCAGGMIIQMLPGAEEGAVEALEDLLANIKPITSLIDEVNAGNSDKAGGRGCKSVDGEEAVRELAGRIFAQMPSEYALQELSVKEIRWSCDCSEARLEQVLITIGEKDLREIIEEDGQAELVCQFCLKKYHFNEAKLRELLRAATGITKD